MNKIPSTINGKRNPEYRRLIYWLKKGYTKEEYLNIKDELDKKKLESLKRSEKRGQKFVSRRSKMSKYEYNRDSYLRNMYGISLEKYNEILLLQKNKCKICNKNFKNSTDANLDHCHNTLIIRGLLCSKCNKGLGLFDDNIDYLKEAINYLGK